MNEIESLLRNTLNIEFIQAVVSNPRIKEGILKYLLTIIYLDNVYLFIILVTKHSIENKTFTMHMAKRLHFSQW